MSMEAALRHYADTFCELGEHHECCGRLSKDECSGCLARAALAPSAGERIIDLDASDWDALLQAANESTWMPPEYMRNDWISDLCRFLREGSDAFRPPATPVQPAASVGATAQLIERLRSTPSHTLKPARPGRGLIERWVNNADDLKALCLEAANMLASLTPAPTQDDSALRRFYGDAYAPPATPEPS